MFFFFELKVVTTNNFFTTILNCLIVKIDFIKIYVLSKSSNFRKLIFMLLKMMNGILKTIFVFKFASKKFFEKKQNFTSLFFISNDILINTNVSRLM